MPSLINQMIVQEIAGAIDQNPYVFISAYEGISVESIAGLRRKLDKLTNRSVVVKHSLVLKAFETVNIPLNGIAEESFKGHVVLTLGDKDPQAISKVLVDYGKTNEKFVTGGVIFERNVFGKEFVKSLASLPSRHELLTQMVVRMKSPITGFVLTLNQVLKGFVIALNEIKNKKAGEQPAQV